jgi:hypothetical protein
MLYFFALRGRKTTQYCVSFSSLSTLSTKTMYRTVYYIFACAVVAAALASCSSKDTPTGTTTVSASTLTPFKLASDADAPDYTSSTIESIWTNASPFTVNVSPIGNNFSGSSFPVTIQSIVSSQNIYFLVQYNDAEANYLEQPLKFKGGNSSTPSNWVLDSASHEDGVSFFFESVPGTSGTKTFSADGCTMLCHTASSPNGAGMYSENSGRYDTWFWHAGKGNGCGLADDDICIGDPVFAIQKDNDNDETYTYNVLGDPDFLPYSVAGGANRNLDKKYFIATETAKALSSTNPATSTAWAAGDIVPSYTVALPVTSSDYYDVKAQGYWANGKWIVKFQRKLNTSSTLDTRFLNGVDYPFSFAIHNNTAPGNHFGVANKSFILRMPN